MKKLILLLLLPCFFLFSGCGTPDSLQMDLYQGYGDHLRLIHLNASTSEKRELIQDIWEVIQNAEPLEKDISDFAYYPDYLLEYTDKDAGGETFSYYVDLNGDFVDLYAPNDVPLTIHRAKVTAKEFQKLVHHV